MDPKDQPFISIGMPTYRRATFIRQSLESCLKQNYTNFEIIVHDDTEDNSLKSIIESYSSEKVRYLRNVPPIGLVSKLNDFLEKSSAPWMLILCDDDYLEPDFLNILSRHIQNHPSATLVRSCYRLVDYKGEELRLDRTGAFRSNSFEFLRDLFLPESKNFKMNISGILFPRLLLKSLGGFKNLYRAWHVDRLAWAELGARGESICEPTPLCNIRLHADSLTAFTEPNYKNAVAADLKLKELVEQLFDETEKKAQTDEQRNNLKKARKNLHAYTNRHLSKSLDCGFIAVLENKEKNVVREMKDIFKTMRDLKVPLFRSAVLYRLLTPFSYPTRTWALKTLRRYKIKKLTS